MKFRGIKEVVSESGKEF